MKERKKVLKKARKEGLIEGVQQKMKELVQNMKFQGLEDTFIA